MYQAICGRIARFPLRARAQRFASTLIIAEHDNNTLSPNTRSAVTAASNLRGDVSILVMGNGSQTVAEQAAAVGGVSKVIHADDPAHGKWVAENISRAVVAVQSAGSFSHIMALSTMAGKNFIGRLGAELDCSPVTDVIKIVSEDTFVRPMYAGNSIATVRAAGTLKLLSIRPTAFEKASAEGEVAAIEEAQVPEGGADAGLASIVSEAVSGGDRPDLTAAGVVVSGGRGLQDGSNFKMLEELADKLGGAVGASRAAVDAGFVPNELQVGQTGKVVAPDLYIAVGISGAIQHLSGMKDSKCIVAINKDKEAPIFQAADYGLVADLFDAVPELTSKV
ncbi:unnamed protein product [Discosporangium mesarthrocarpum]